MSGFTRTGALTVFTIAAALGTSVAASPVAQAAVRPTAIPGVTYVQSAAHHPLSVRPMTVWVNCSTVTEGEQGSQYYLGISCSDVSATSWEFAMECSNSSWYYSGFFTTFENVQLYCPAGTWPVSDVVYYTT
jgi:hypothetical protein